MSNQEVIDEIVSTCAKDLFAAYGLEVSSSTPRDEDLELSHAGVIGFCGESMRGTLLLVPCKSVVERTHSAEDVRAQDWVGELANQLLGRIKNQLLKYGTELFMTTPLVLKGQHIAPTPRGEPKPHCFRAGEHEQLMVWFDAELSPDAQLVPVDASSIPQEGDALIF